MIASNDMTLKVYFSVIIPTYNRGESFLKAVNSVLSQTFTDFEVIIIDDTSTDTTKEKSEAIEDVRVSYYRNESNQERCISRNRGIEKANGKYICFLDSDDYHLPNHLEELHEFIQSKSEPQAFFFTNAWNETDDGVRSSRECPNFDDYNSYSYFLHYTVNPQRWAVHRSVFQKVKFDPSVVICEDMDTSLRILSAGYSVYQLQKRTTVYVQALDSFTLSDNNKAEKELFYLKRIFAKSELKNKLPNQEKNRLLSMCYYHLAVKAFSQNQKWNVLKNSGKSFVSYPAGYNGSTNKPLIVMSLYALPIIGWGMKKIIGSFK